MGKIRGTAKNAIYGGMNTITLQYMYGMNVFTIRCMTLLCSVVMRSYFKTLEKERKVISTS